MAIFPSNGQSYRHLAADLRRQAAESPNAEIRQDLLVLAVQYERLAEKYARLTDSESPSSSGWQTDAAGD